VEFDPAADGVIVDDSQRNRLQICKKVCDDSDFQASSEAGRPVVRAGIIRASPPFAAGRP
jgi:hypothetical protein